MPVDSSFTHAIAHTPAGPVENCRSFLFLSTSGGLPRRSRRSAPALTVSRIARRSLTLWPACLLTPRGSLFRECFSPIRYLLEPLQVLPVGATSYRAGFAPAGINKPFTAHRPKRVTARGVKKAERPLSSSKIRYSAVDSAEISADMKLVSADAISESAVVAAWLRIFVGDWKLSDAS